MGKSSLLGLAREITVALGPEWTAPDGDRAEIVLKSDPHCGMDLHHVNGRLEQLGVTGMYRYGLRGEDGLRSGEKRAEIGFAAKKTTEQIACDIERRFLPTYLEQYQRNKAAVAEAEVYTRDLKATEERIGAAISKYNRLNKANYNRPGVGVQGFGRHDVTLVLRNVPIGMAELLIETMSKRLAWDEHYPEGGGSNA